VSTTLTPYIDTDVVALVVPFKTKVDTVCALPETAAKSAMD
jgi:hypothetical protein